MQLVIGLGNPGPDYATTRHNLGFHVLDEVARRQGLRFSTVTGLYAWARWQRPSGSCILMKPLTYMNLSGRAVIAWAERNCMLPQLMDADGGVTPVVVCDDLALPLGAVRIRPGGSAGGQKGLASIIQALGSQELARLRLGIAPPGSGVESRDWSAYVLEPLAEGDLPRIREMVHHAADALVCLLGEGPEKAAARFNRRESPLDEE